MPEAEPRVNFASGYTHLRASTYVKNWQATYEVQEPC